MLRMNRQRGGGGFTLIESLLASALLAMTIAAITTPFTAAARNEQADARRTIASSLGRELMEEILSRPFDDPDGAGNPGPETGESARQYFDNIDDYHGYAEAAGEMVDGDGNRIADAAAHGLSRSATVTYVYVSGQEISGSPNFGRVEVEVRWKAQPLLTVTRLVYGM